MASYTVEQQQVAGKTTTKRSVNQPIATQIDEELNTNHQTGEYKK